MNTKQKKVYFRITRLSHIYKYFLLAIRKYLYFLGRNPEAAGERMDKKQTTKELLITQESQEKSESIPSKTSSPSSSEKSSSEKIDQKSNLATSSISDLRPYPTVSRFTTSAVTSPTATKPPLRRRHTAGPGMTFPATDPPTYSSSMTFSKTSPLPSPHLDKRFFDSSLIEMKSQASSSSTLDYDSTEEIWVRRLDLVHDKKRRVRLFLLYSSIKMRVYCAKSHLFNNSRYSCSHIDVCFSVKKDMFDGNLYETFH